MDWPPQVGELLPRAEEAVGVREKLERYSLDFAHPVGRAKAIGFALILGITAEEIGYLAAEIHAGIRRAPIKSLRQNPPFGISCVVEFPLHGLAERRDRVANLRTAWQLEEATSPPRLTSAYLKP